MKRFFVISAIIIFSLVSAICVLGFLDNSLIEKNTSFEMMFYGGELNGQISVWFSDDINYGVEYYKANKGSVMCFGRFDGDALTASRCLSEKKEGRSKTCLVIYFLTAEDIFVQILQTTHFIFRRMSMRLCHMCSRKLHHRRIISILS